MMNMDGCNSNENIANQTNGEIPTDPINGNSPSMNGYRISQNGSSHSSSASTASSDVGCYPASPDTDNDNVFPHNLNNSVTEIEYSIPIVGYEISEEKARFTVFKLQINNKSSGESWYIYRRYTDFMRLNRKLKQKFPKYRLVLPPKRWFGDNFDSCFLEERSVGLQTYINNLLANKVLCQSCPVRDFFCFDDPPPFEENMESRCESLEENVYKLEKKLKEKQEEINYLNAELTLCKTQLATVLKAIKLQSSFSSLPISDVKLSTSLTNLYDINSALLNVIEKSTTSLTLTVHPEDVNLSVSTPDLRRLSHKYSNNVVNKEPFRVKNSKT